MATTPGVYYDWDPTTSSWTSKTQTPTSMPDTSVNPTSGARDIKASDPMQGWTDLSSVIGAYGSGQKANRALEGQFTQNYDRLMLEAQQDKRAQEADAMKKIQQAAYLQGGGSHFTPGSMVIGGKTYNIDPHGLEPPKVTDPEMQAANMLSQTMLKRLGPSGSYSPTAIDKYAKPGTLERITDIAGPIAGGVGAIDRLMGGKLTGGLASAAGKLIPGLGGAGAGAATTVMDEAGNAVPLNIGGAGGGMGSFIFGKALPIAGAIHGGYELLKNKSLGSDIMSGAESGAGIGTLIAPGIGTAAGAGIGALAGWGRHAFGGPDKVEQEGRGAGSEAFNALASQATPEQMAQAQQAGWGNPNEAAAYIVMGDRLRAMGLNPALADQYMKEIQEAQKHGGQAVQAALSPIDSMLSGRG